MNKKNIILFLLLGIKYIFFLQLRCCGVDSMNDWNEIMPDGTLPRSCCPITDDDSVSTCTIRSENVYMDACFSLLESIIVKNANLLIGVGIGIAFVEVCIILH